MPAIVDKPSMERSQNESFDEEKNAPIVKDARLNSHHHDSEYDTASDDGGDDDDYDDEDDESLGADGEEDESENGSVGFDLERQRGDGQEQEYSKKVDEDRSNPQYIPKKGNFYEHDDRTLDEPEGTEGKAEDGDDEQTKSSTPNNSQASKTMKKWQPASAVDRWSHDRYDESEQAPKSRQELVSAYGYDIRSEDGPPRPRRRRRYGRGPNKYNRNWEDESAYIKSNNNSQRKPRPEDFPALGDRDKRPTRKSRSFREEKENRYDRDSERTSTTFNRGTNISQRDGRIEKRNSGKSFRSGRQSLEFRNQNKNRIGSETQMESVSSSAGRKADEDDISKIECVVQMDTNPHYSNNVQVERQLVPGVKVVRREKVNSSQNDNKKFNQVQNISPDKVDKTPPAATTINSNMGISAGRQQVTTPTLASRLQVQNRNDPSHVGSIQMHSIMSQTQPEMGAPQQQQPQTSEASRTKRYSSLRQRTQNDAVAAGPQPTIVDQHTLAQQIQMHDHHQAHPTQQHVLLQDQHLLQANIMQLYHTQENLQAQMQGVTLQGLSGGHQQKPQYQNVQPQYQASAPTPAYYATTAEYPQQTTPAVTPQYTQQQPAAAYIQPQPAASPMATYNPQPQANGGTPAPLSYVQTQAPGAPPYQNFAGYQNYNTVGGTTYFVPQQQTTARPVVLPQRRPTNAIPILAPPNDKQKIRTEKDDDAGKIATSTSSNAPLGSAENIDHILDNMFVQRPPLQPPTRKSSSPSTESTGTSTNPPSDDKSITNQSTAQKTTSATIAESPSADASRLEDGVKNMTLTDDNKPSDQQQQPQSPPPQITNSASGAPAAPQELTTATTSETG